MANMALSIGATATAPPLIPKPDWMSGQSGGLPNEITQSAAKAPTTPKPVYSGPHINSVPHVVSALGAGLAVNQGGVFVNGQRINATRYVNGVPHAPVHQIAHAAGYPSTHVTMTPQATTVMPHNTASQPLLARGSNGSAVRNLQQELMQMGYNVGSTGADGIYGSNTAAAVRQFQTDHHLGRDGVVGPQTWAALNSYHNAAPKHSVAASPTNAQAASAPSSSAPAQPTDPLSQVMQGNPYLQSIIGTMPQAPQQVQMPTAPTLQPFQWDAQQGYQNAYNQLAPTYMNQMSMADQKLNAGLNNRNIYNSGIAQQMQDQQDQGIYNKLDNAAMTQAQNDQKQAFTQWNDQTTQIMNDYKAQIQADYDQGRINDQQYTEAVSQWNDAAKYLQDMYDQQQAMQKALIPYTMGPTPQQQITDSISQQKVQAQIQQWAATDKLKADQIAQTGQIAQAKLDVQVSRDAQLAQEAAINASNKEVSTQLTGLHEQLVAAGNYLKTLQATPGANKADIQNAVNSYNKIMDQISAVVSAEGQAASNP